MSANITTPPGAPAPAEKKKRGPLRKPRFRVSPDQTVAKELRYEAPGQSQALLNGVFEANEKHVAPAVARFRAMLESNPAVRFDDVLALPANHTVMASLELIRTAGERAAAAIADAITHLEDLLFKADAAKTKEALRQKSLQMQEKKGQSRKRTRSAATPDDEGEEGDEGEDDGEDAPVASAASSEAASASESATVSSVPIMPSLSAVSVSVPDVASITASSPLTPPASPEEASAQQ